MNPIALITGPMGLKIGAAALAAALLWGGIQTYRIGSLEADLLRQQAEWNAKILVQTNKAFAESERNRLLETKMAQDAAENRNALDAAREINRTAAAGFAAERSRVRDTITGFATGRGLTPQVAADTCSERSAALGRSLDATLSAEESLVEQLEDQRSDTRTLLRDARLVREVK